MYIFKGLFYCFVCLSVLPHVSMCTMSVPGACRGQQKALYPLGLEFEPLCDCWKAHQDPLQEVLLTTMQTLQRLVFIFKNMTLCLFSINIIIVTY